MFGKIKKILYFPLASYFAIFAKIRLIIWKPKIIVITGSSGKTTLLHMVESQLGEKAKYSHTANSSFGLPFNILGLKRKDLTLIEWPMLFIKAPFCLFKKFPKEKIYIAEADCDRPFEGKFLGWLLKPSITLWLNTTKTHSVNFDSLAGDLLTNITKEFGEIAKKTKDLLIYNGDQANLKKFVSNLSVHFESINSGNYNYIVDLSGTAFDLGKEKYKFKYLLPEKTIYQILMTKKLMQILGLEFDETFKRFKHSFGRSSFFEGIKDTILVDSTYNANLDSMTQIISMFSKLKSDKKWVVLGDMIEQGKNEKLEHKKLAEIINLYNFSKIILMGPRVKKYTAPKIKNAVVFERPDSVLKYLQKNIKGGEVILFKGARFLEGVLEALLKNKKNSKKLIRREKVWQKRREKFGLIRT